MTDKSNTQAAPMQGLSAWLRMLASHQSKYMSQDAATLLTWAAEVDAAQPTPEPVVQADNVTVTSPSGSTWEVDPKWAQALQAALDGKAASDRRPWAIFDSQGFYRLERSEVEARAFCDTYNARNPNDPLRPYICCAMDDVRPPAQSPSAEAEPVKLTPYNPTEAMRWAMKGIDPALSHEQCRALWSAAWTAVQSPSAEAAEPGHGLTTEQADLLLTSSLKPEEIGGAPDLQHRRVRELLHWFARLTQGNANPKWLRGHAFELAYYVATMGPDRSLDVDAIRKAGFLEGVNISPEDRRMLERIGTIPAQSPSAEMLNGLTEAETADSASVAGLTATSAERGRDADGQKWIDNFYTANGYYPSLMQVWRAALAAQPAAPLFAAPISARKWRELQADGHRMTLIQFDGGKGGPGSIDPGGVVMWGAQPAAQQGGPVAEGLVVVDMVPPATARDRWMYEQGRLAERDARTHAIEAASSPVALQGRDERWKVGNEFAPFHKSASHVNPDYRDGWNACYEAARASLPAGFTPEQVAELVAARDKILSASLPAGGVVEPVAWRGRNSLGEVVTDWLEYQHQTAEGVKKLFADEGGTVEYAYAAPRPSETQGRGQMTDAEAVKAFRDCRDRLKLPRLDWQSFSLGRECAEHHHGIPASPQDGGEQS